MPHERYPEQDESLWLLAAGPLIWAVHFGASYALAAVWCAKVAGLDASLGDARWILAALTAVALIALGVLARVTWRRHRAGEGRPPHADDTPDDRHRFLGYAAFLLTGLSAIAVVYEALAIALVGSCE